MERKIKQPTVSAVIHLAVCYRVGLYNLQDILRSFKQFCPGTEVHVHYGQIDQVHHDVLENPVALGLVAYPRHQPGLAIVPYRKEPLMLICHPQHPFATRSSITAAMLKGQPLIAWNEIPFFSSIQNKPLISRHLQEPRHRFKEVELVKRSVEMNVGVTLLPVATVVDEVAQQRLAAVPFENGRLVEPLAAIYRKCRKPPTAVKQFVDFLKAR